MQQHLGGGALPTPEAYERALDQWHRLPGAVRGPAAELHPDAGTAAEFDDGPAGAEAETDLDVDIAFALDDELEPEFDVDTGSSGPPTAPIGQTYEGPLPATDPGDNRAYERRRR